MLRLGTFVSFLSGIHSRYRSRPLPQEQGDRERSKESETQHKTDIIHDTKWAWGNEEISGAADQSRVDY